MKQIKFLRELFVPSTIEGLSKCLETVYELIKLFNLDADTSFCLHTVIVESVENAIIHGNKRRTDSDVRVSFAVNKKEILVEVEDRGNGFDLNSVPSTIEESALQDEGGRGIYFIKSLSSSVYTKGKGNVLRIKFNR